MSVRLIQISKDLNVGISSLVEFLQKKGVEVESNPNAKIDSGTQEMLIKEFGGTSALEDFRRKQDSIKTKAKQKETIAESDKNKKIEQTKPDTVHVEEAEKRNVLAFNVVDKIELDDKNRPVLKKQVKDTIVEPKNEATETTKIKAEVKKETPQQEVPLVEKQVIASEVKVEEKVSKTEAVKEEKITVTPAEPKVMVKPETEKVAEAKVEKTSQNEENETSKTTKPQEVISESKNIIKQKDTAEVEDVSSTMKNNNQEEEVFRLRDSSIESNIVIKGSIDLDTINDKTRPAKKSKSEKKKEQQEKEALEQKRQRENAAATTPTVRKELVKKSKEEQELEDGKKKKRNRIKKGRVDIEKGATQPQNLEPANKGKAKTLNKNSNTAGPRKTFNKVAVSEEDVQKQIKETLARLTDNKRAKNKGARYRKEKRDAQSLKVQEELESQERESKILKITEFVTANDLANMMDVPVIQVIQTCMSIGIMVSINQRLDAETINIVVSEFGFETEYVSAEVIEAIAEEEDNEEDLVARPPIVTVMGHVDHGKTSLLDYVRSANVIAGEAGGITQHIGAYNVQLKSGRRITFLDTPGHEAFTAMRARGAQITDIAIIIVAADDNVMPQTVEAINHASAAGVPIIFAINKIDKPSANPEKIKETLAGMNYLVEDWGGKYQSQEISAKKGLGVEELLEKILLEAEILDLKANPNRRAVGSIIESSLDKGRGYTSTVMVQNGTMKVGDVILAGTSFGRVRAMFNERNQNVDKASPSEPVQILGLNGAPQAGDMLHVLESEQEAREIASKREQLQREQGLRTQKILTLDDIGRRIAIGNFQQLNLIVKGDMDGSVEALSDSLLQLSTPEIQLNVIHKGVGQISESDVTLAAASDAIIVGFQVRPSQQARKLAESDGVDIRLYSIIYDAIEEIKSAMEGMLSPEIKEVVCGYVEVREVFKITKVGTVAGCFVKEGKLKRTHKIRLVRDGIVVYSGQLGSLKRYKDDAKEVVAGLECGLNIHNFNDIKAGDFIEPFEEIEIKKTL